jgi:hypothetical protein
MRPLRAGPIYESRFQRLVRERCRLQGRPWELLRRVIVVIIGRRLTASGSDLLVVLQVPESGAHRPDAAHVAWQRETSVMAPAAANR